MIGSYILHIIDPVWLMNAIICIVCGFALFNVYRTFIKQKPAPEVKQHQWKHFLLITPLLGFFLAMYNNILSLGEASIGTLLLISVLGQSYLEARGTVQVIFVIPRFIAFYYGIVSGLLYFPLVISLWIGGAIGGYLGAKLSFVIPEQKLQKLFAVVAFFIAAYLVHIFWL